MARWSIGVYSGPTPLNLKPVEGIQNPVITAANVTDVRSLFVADPFLLQRESRHFLFFEIFSAARQLGEIAYATSSDGLKWEYGGAVLRESFHLSYPHVFEAAGETYLVPETRQANSIRLYRADSFPDRWRFIREIRRGDFADATIVRHEERWWLFAQRGLDELRLFSASEVDGDWVEHPQSPLWPGNRTYTRPGGRMLPHAGRLFRFAQDGVLNYGRNLRAIEIDRLNEREYAEHELECSPILEASLTGWNAVGMHHIDVQRVGGKWLAMVDGANVSFQ